VTIDQIVNCLSLKQIRPSLKKNLNQFVKMNIFSEFIYRIIKKIIYKSSQGRLKVGTDNISFVKLIKISAFLNPAINFIYCIHIQLNLLLINFKKI
jgi:branched-subunit amino acid permease